MKQLARCMCQIGQKKLWNIHRFTCLQTCTGRLNGIWGSQLAQHTLRAARMNGNTRFAHWSRSSPCGFICLVAATLPRGTPLRFWRRLSLWDQHNSPFHIAHMLQIDGKKKSHFKFGTSGNFYRKPWDGRGLTLSSRPPSFLSIFSLQPFRSLTTHWPSRVPQFHNSLFPPSSCPIDTNTNCATRQLPSINSSPPNCYIYL